MRRIAFFLSALCILTSPASARPKPTDRGHSAAFEAEVGGTQWIQRNFGIEMTARLFVLDNADNKSFGFINELSFGFRGAPNRDTSLTLFGGVADSRANDTGDDHAPALLYGFHGYAAFLEGRLAIRARAKAVAEFQTDTYAFEGRYSVEGRVFPFSKPAYEYVGEEYDEPHWGRWARNQEDREYWLGLHVEQYDLKMLYGVHVAGSLLGIFRWEAAYDFGFQEDVPDRSLRLVFSAGIE